MGAPLLNSHHTWECRRSQSRTATRTAVGREPSVRRGLAATEYTPTPVFLTADRQDISPLSMRIARPYAGFPEPVRFDGSLTGEAMANCSELNIQGPNYARVLTA